MQESGIEWVGEIPQEWKIKRTKNILILKSSNVDKKTYKEQQKVILCNYVDVYYNDTINSSIAFMKSTASMLEINKFHLQVGDVVLTKDSEDPCDIAVSAYVSEEIDNLVCGYHLAIMQPKQNSLNGKFLFWAMQSTGIKEQFYRLANGITRYGLKKRDIDSVLLPLPKILEQQKIAKYLNHHCAKLDKVIALKQQQIKTLDALRQSTIYQAVTKGLDDSVPLVNSGVEWLGDIPEGWKRTKAKHVSDVFIPQRNKPLINDDTGCYWVTMENMKNPIILKTDKFISSDAQQKAGSKVLPKLSVIASCVGTFGIASVNIVDVIINQQLQAYRPVTINPYYLRYLITISKKYFEQVCTQTTISYVNGDKFECLPVLLPPAKEQQTIATYLDQETQRLNTLKENLNQQINTLQAYKKSLIYEMVTGKKRI